jgi:hypothetical protein
MSAGHKENSTSAEPTPATSQSHEDNDTIVEEISKKRRKYHGARHLHRLAFKGRPETDCAADHPDIQGTNSLCWTFLKLTDAVHDAHQSLVSGVITCAFCIKDGKHSPKKWVNWNKKKSQGSTGNFKEHFESSHLPAWQKASADDLAVIDPERAAQSSAQPSASQTTLHNWANSVSMLLPHTFIRLTHTIPKIFNVEEFHRHLIEWIVVSNQPFTEVDNPQFRCLISYGKPIIAEKMVHATQLKERLLAEFEKARGRFKNTLKVC